MSRIGRCVSIDEDDVFDADTGFGSAASHRRSSSLVSFPSFLSIDGGVRRSFSYDKLPVEPISLSILKLDGSSFDVRVMGIATVRELKEAVESAFDHMPKKGPEKISWRHVWGHFCLCYDGQKLLNESDLIVKYGIKDADQCSFIKLGSPKGSTLSKEMISKSFDISQVLMSWKIRDLLKDFLLRNSARGPRRDRAVVMTRQR